MKQSRTKNIETLYPSILGKRIQIYTKSYYMTGEVTGFTGMYLLLKDVEYWTGNRNKEDSIHAQWITKIEFEKKEL